MKKTVILDLDVSFSHVKFQVCRMKRSEVTAVSAGEVFSAIFGRFGGPGATPSANMLSGLSILMYGNPCRTKLSLL